MKCCLTRRLAINILYKKKSMTTVQSQMFRKIYTATARYGQDGDTDDSVN